MISICIPTYEQRGKGAHFLKILLDSIASQVYAGPFQVLISDNSTDSKVKDLVDSYRIPGAEIRYVLNPIRGASENINNSIDFAKYDKIKPMMQDDYFTDPRALQRFSDALDRAGWVISDSYHVSGAGTRTGGRSATYDPTNFKDNAVGMPSVIGFRRSDLRFDPRLKTYCDLYFYYQLYQMYGHPVKIAGYNVAQRYHVDSLSRNQPPSHERDRRLLVSEGKIPGTLPRVVVAVVVYNRWDNINRWLKVWGQCDTAAAELVIIVNNDNETYPEIEYPAGIKFIARPNVGFDIGAFQDVCRERLAGFPKEYDYLLWCTDDTIPMSPTFISQFLDRFGPKVGAVCMQISPEWTRHIRTTGFMIPRWLAPRLTFPADPITTVAECWAFEHRGGPNTLLKQIERLGYGALQVCNIASSPLYDMGFWYRNAQARAVAKFNDRMNEHNRVFNNTFMAKTG